MRTLNAYALSLIAEGPFGDRLVLVFVALDLQVTDHRYRQSVRSIRGGFQARQSERSALVRNPGPIPSAPVENLRNRCCAAPQLTVAGRNQKSLSPPAICRPDRFRAQKQRISVRMHTQ